MNKYLSIAVAALLLSFMPVAAAASPPGDDRPQLSEEERAERRARMRTRILAKRSEVLRTRAGLDETKATAVEAVLKTFDAEREVLHQRKFALRRATRQLLESGSNDQAAFDKLLDDKIAIGVQMHDLRLKQVAAIRAALDAKSALRTITTLHRLKRRMHRGKHHKFGKHHRRGKRHMKRGHRGAGGDDGSEGIDL